MGDIKKLKKKYFTSAHPWIRTEIAENKAFREQYGLKKKKEILIATSFLKKYKDMAKRLIADSTAQGATERKQIVEKLQRLGLLQAGSKLDDVLSLTTQHMLDRRLQSLLVRKGLARSPIQARQFITHRHILVGGKEITSPSYITSVEEETNVTFKPSSPYASADHAERIVMTTPKKEKPKREVVDERRPRRRRQ